MFVEKYIGGEEEGRKVEGRREGRRRGGGGRGRGRRQGKGKIGGEIMKEMKVWNPLPLVFITHFNELWIIIWGSCPSNVLDTHLWMDRHT